MAGASCGFGGILITTNWGLTSINIQEILPGKYKLYQNYPNPFNPETKIKFDLPIDNYITINVYDIFGKEIYTLVNDFKQAGRYAISFNGSNFSSGIYYYKLKARNFEHVRKMVLLK